MLMSVVEMRSGVEALPEIAGHRVLITGLTTDAGVDVTRAFADHKARLVVQSHEDGPEITALASLVAETASDIKLYNTPIRGNDDAVRLAQSAAQAYGGLDAVINIVTFTREELARTRTVQEIESLIAGKLLPMTLISRVAANRMRLMMGEGTILNVVLCPAPAGNAETALIGVIRAALAAMTKGEAKEWAGQSIRINAVGPRGAEGEPVGGLPLASEPEIATLALHLASRKGRQLTGFVFDAGLVTKG
jgi:3-oxoacyl-[acyl-carrier protein] reductase